MVHQCMNYELVCLCKWRIAHWGRIGRASSLSHFPNSIHLCIQFLLSLQLSSYLHTSMRCFTTSRVLPTNSNGSFNSTGHWSSTPKSSSCMYMHVWMQFIDTYFQICSYYGVLAEAFIRKYFEQESCRKTKIPLWSKFWLADCWSGGTSQMCSQLVLNAGLCNEISSKKMWLCYHVIFLVNIDNTYFTMFFLTFQLG